MSSAPNKKPIPRPKVKHYDIPGHAHFLTFSCYRRLPLLSKDRSRWWFVRALEKARRRHEFDLWAWVVMPEHVHLLLWPRQPVYRMAKILASIKKPVGARAFAYVRARAPDFLERLTVRHRNRIYHRFWQAGPGRDQNLYEPASIHRAIAYIHNNPVRRGLAVRPEDWLWSSAAEWAGQEPLYLAVDRTVPSLESFLAGEP
jgi:putative transposase